MDVSTLVREAFAILRRRWLLLALPLVIGAPLAVGVAMVLPPTYESTARIIVEAQVISDDLARSTVAQSASERIQLIRRRLLTRDNLLAIAERHGMFADRPGLTPTDVVNSMRQSVRISGQSTGSRNNRQVTGVDISVTSSSAGKAAAVANDLVSRILEQNVQQRTNLAQGTLAFFNEEVARLDAEITSLSARIARFKQDNAMALPDSLQARQNELSNLRERRFVLEKRRADVTERLEFIRKAQAEGRVDVLADLIGSPVQRELFQLRNNLAVQRSVLSESHPTIRRLSDRIAVLQRIALEEGETSGGVEAELAELSGDLADIETTMARDATRIEELEESLRMTPVVELELRSLERELQSLQARYTGSLSRQAQAELGERLEVTQQAERFEVIEQAVASGRPVAPRRGLIMAAGVTLSGMVGFGLLVLAELLNRSVRSAADVERQLELTPIVSVPYIATQWETTWRKWRLRAILGLCVIAVPLMLFAVDRFYAPLSVVAERLMERSGMDDLIALIAARLDS